VVAGILLPSFSFTRYKPRMVGGDLRIKVSDWEDEDLRFRRSLSNVENFWKAASHLYDEKPIQNDGHSIMG